MTTRITAAVAQALLNGLTSASGAAPFNTNGRINVYTGSQPATAATAATGTLLATSSLSSTAFGSASGATLTANAIGSATAVATGVPGYIRIYNNTDTAPGSAATSTDERVDLACGVRTTLNGAVSSGATTIPVPSTVGFPSSGSVTINGTTVSYTGKTSTTFTGCTGTPTAANGDAVLQAGVECWFSNANLDGTGQILNGNTVTFSSLQITINL